MRSKAVSMQRAHKIKLNPTPEQEVYFRKACGVARFAYNWGLAEWKKEYAAGGKPNWMALKKKWTLLKAEQFPWTGEVTSYAYQRAFQNLGKAFTFFFKRVKSGGKTGYPKFKKRGKSVSSFYLANNSLKTNGHEVYVEKLGWVNMTQPLRFSGKIMGGVVSERAGKWFISIQVDDGQPIPAHRPGPTVGVDLGIKTMARTSLGEAFESLNPLRSNLARLRKLSRALSRRIPGSKRYEKAKQSLARCHDRISNVRSESIHQATNALTHRGGVIGLEDLNVSGMLQNRRLSRAISDVSPFEFRRQIEYKSESRGVRVQVVNRFFPSSQLCNACGYRHRDLSLADREWVCPGCGAQIDRDLNAAQNIRDEAARLVAASGTTQVGRKTLVDDPRPLGGSVEASISYATRIC